MNSSTDFLVIGGGIMGTSIALHLVELGLGSVTLLEKRFLGAGSSGKSEAILRAHYSQPIAIAMARDGITFYGGFAGRTGRDIGFRNSGVVILGREADRQALTANVERMRLQGVETRILEAAELRTLEPRADMAADAIGAYEPGGGYVDPVKTVGALAAVAVEHGLRVQLDTRVERLLVDGERVTGAVLVGGEQILAGAVIVCAGAWAGPLVRPLAGNLELPLQPIRPEQAFFEPPADFGAATAVYCDLETGIYWKPEQSSWTRVGKMEYEGDELLADPDDYDEGIGGRFVEFCRPRIAARLPAYERAVDWGGCGALYTITPDSYPLVGPLPGVEGLTLVSGWSGHGFKMGPATGKGVAGLVTGTDLGSFDPSLFDPTRFSRGAQVEGSHRYGILG